MGFEEFFENNRNDYRNNRGNSYSDENSYNSRYPLSANGENEKWKNILEKIRSDKRLKLLVVLSGLVILTIIIFLVIVLHPLFLKLINYITQNGLQGVLNEITGFLDKLLKGTAN
jgi:uncharacterized membrane protein